MHITLYWSTWVLLGYREEHCRLHIFFCMFTFCPSCLLHVNALSFEDIHPMMKL